MPNCRVLAIQLCQQIVDQQCSLSTALPELIKRHSLSAVDKAIVQALCFGVLRDYLWLQALIKPLLSKPLKKSARVVELALLLGAYQLTKMRIPAHAAIHETVEAVKELKQQWAVKFVNGVLRQLQRDQDNLVAQANQKEPYSHPQWLVEMIKKAYPAQWKSILEQNQQAPPMHIRVNQKKCSQGDYLKLLADHGIGATAAGEVGITLDKPTDVNALPHFNDGWVSVQDLAAQYAVECLAPQNGETILDACAAPGGKTGYILEIAPQATLFALDHDAKRLERVKQNLERLGLSAQCVIGDASQQSWWLGDLFFDRILIDAPCSATGVIRRHPDIKLLRRASDIQNLAKQQLAVLENLWPMLKPGGTLVYATCSILPQENDQVIKEFLKNHDAKTMPLKTTSGQATKYGWQFFPEANGTDGFYIAKLNKHQ